MFRRDIFILNIRLFLDLFFGVFKCAMFNLAIGVIYGLMCSKWWNPNSQRYLGFTRGTGFTCTPITRVPQPFNNQVFRRFPCF